MELALRRRPTREEAELEQYRPDLQRELRECLADLAHNQMLFDLEVEPELIEQRIFEREALNCRYRYLMRMARDTGLHAILR